MIGGMRKITKICVKVLLGLAIVAVLVTLLSPYTPNLHPRLPQNPNPSPNNPHVPPTPLRLQQDPNSSPHAPPTHPNGPEITSIPLKVQPNPNPTPHAPPTHPNNPEITSIPLKVQPNPNPSTHAPPTPLRLQQDPNPSPHASPTHPNNPEITSIPLKVQPNPNPTTHAPHEPLRLQDHNPSTHTPLTPQQDPNPSPHATPTHPNNPETTQIAQTNPKSKEKNFKQTSENGYPKTQTAGRMDTKVDGPRDNQEDPQPPPLSYPTPEGYVEVAKDIKKPMIWSRIQGKELMRRRKERLKDVKAKFLKVLGYSPKELQERAKSFPDSSPMAIFLKEQQRRIAHTTATCRLFRPSLAEVVGGSRGPPLGLLSVSHIIYDRINLLTFCPVYKAASTSWTVNLIQLAGLWTDKAERQQVQKLVKAFYPKISGLGVNTITSNTTHFMVVRHPLERLLSCYLDKFQYATKDYYYHTYGEKIIMRYRESLRGVSIGQVKAMQDEVRRAMRRGGAVNLPHNPFATPLGPSFPEFVEHVVNTKYDDEHWKTYTSHCAPCSLQYQFVLKFESLQEENERFLEYLNRTGEVKQRWDNPNNSGDTKKLSCQYYGQLSLRQINNLEMKYIQDLRLYEYDAEEYRKCAKDYHLMRSSTESYENVTTTNNTNTNTNTNTTIGDATITTDGVL